MSRPVLTISSKNYSSWSLRGWLLCRLAGLDFDEQVISIDDPENRALARQLLRVSVIYLPLLLLAMMLDANGRLLF